MIVVSDKFKIYNKYLSMDDIYLNYRIFVKKKERNEKLNKILNEGTAENMDN